MSSVKKCDLGSQGWVWVCARVPGEQVEGFHWFKSEHEQTIITEVMAINV